MEPTYVAIRAWCVILINIILSYFEFIMHKCVVNIYQFNKYIKLQYHSIENFIMVLENDIAILLNFGILINGVIFISVITTCHKTHLPTHYDSMKYMYM